jgi:hypothetical protein
MKSKTQLQSALGSLTVGGRGHASLHGCLIQVLTMQNDEYGMLPIERCLRIADPQDDGEVEVGQSRSVL